MTAIRNKRQIIHRRALMADIEQLVEETGKPVEKLRREILAMLKEHLAKGREEIRKRFDAGADGAHVVRENCYLIDQIVRTPVRSGHHPCLSGREPHLGRPAVPGGDRRLWPWRTGPAFRRRSAVPDALQADPARRAGGGIHSLSALGSGAQSRPCGALGRRVHLAGTRRHDHPHQPAGKPPALWRNGAVRGSAPALRHRHHGRHGG